MASKVERCSEGMGGRFVPLKQNGQRSLLQAAMAYDENGNYQFGLYVTIRNTDQRTSAEPFGRLLVTIEPTGSTGYLVPPVCER